MPENPSYAKERDIHAPVEACELPDGIQLVYADDRDRRHAVALEEAALLDFGQVKAFRKPPAYRGQRNFPGWWWSATTRSHVPYESWLARHHVIEADRDARVVAISGQPFELPSPGCSRTPAWTARSFVRAVPSLAPTAISPPGEPPTVRVSFVKTLATDCPGCRERRDGAHADTRLLSRKTACVRHGYWLFGQGGGQRLNLAAIPEVAAAQRRLDRIASRRGPTPAVRAYEIASGYLQYSWRCDHHPPWYPALIERWQQRIRSGGASPAQTTWQFPGWAVHPECTALAAVFATPY